MIHNNNDFICCCDVDGTIVRVATNEDFQYNAHNIISIINPYTNEIRNRVALHPNINLMRQYKAQSYYIRVWSHGGSLWAKAVVEALGLTDIVNSVEAKPIKLIDDLPIEQGVGRTIFVKED